MGYKFLTCLSRVKFVAQLQPPSSTEAALQEFVYNKVYLSYSVDLAISMESGNICGKRDCKEKHNCGFIPNYPVINFGNIEALTSDLIPTPKNSWTDLEDCQIFFEKF